MALALRGETPEAQEIGRKQEELTGLETKLAQRELDLTTLQVELRSLEDHYLRTVGVLFTELDEIQAQIAEAEAASAPQDAAAVEQATQARARAEETRQATDDVGSRPEIPRRQRSESLKAKYREAAKRLHPDLAPNENQRQRREKLMAAANRAYEDGDEVRLQAILDEWERDPDSIAGDDPGSKLIRLIRQIAQATARLEQIDAEITSLTKTKTYQLRTQVLEAEAEGEDHLEELAAGLKNEIAECREQLSRLQESGND